jgi:glycine dehydrogenase subunit 2
VATAETEPLLNELSSPGRPGFRLPAAGVPSAVRPEDCLPGAALRRRPPALPELSELQVVRHFTRLSRLNFSIDTNPYPLGSCTMKYNPKVDDEIAALPGFAGLHPATPDALAQGAIRLLGGLEAALCAITGMAAFSLQPAAGAHGELAGMLVCARYHAARGDHDRRLVVVPDSAHGTNPASAAMAGFEVLEIGGDARGGVNLDELRRVADGRLAALMLTNPNTLGLFEENIAEIAAIVHGAGGLLYYDGANLNAIAGRARPADMGFDICHLNLHKTFATPHGMGGPGAGPVGVSAALEALLPGPRLRRCDDPGETGPRWFWEEPGAQSIGRVRALHGNFGVLVRAYAYILSNGGAGLRAVAAHAVLNANYLMERLRPVLPPRYDRPCMHEFVADGRALAGVGLRALDLCKGLLDRGMHAPTMYFPLIVPEALMFEPTETETPEVLDALAAAVRDVVAEGPAARQAPLRTPVGRVDEALAARRPVVGWHQLPAEAAERPGA